MDRFGGIERIYGEGLDRLKKSHVLIVGLGGVGCWTAEALARSGIGSLTLLDGDEVCISNTNRQLQATQDAVGKPKVEVLAERIRAINPECRVHPVQEFFSMDSRDQHLAPAYDYVVDAIDAITAKMWLIVTCSEKGLPVITTGGAGARRDPTQVTIRDLSETSSDRMLFYLRKKLRSRFDFPQRGQAFGIPCVCSEEPLTLQDACAAEDEDDPFKDQTRLNCEGGLGSLTFVTGTFGFYAAGFVVNELAGKSLSKFAPMFRVNSETAAPRSPARNS